MKQTNPFKSCLPQILVMLTLNAVAVSGFSQQWVQLGGDINGTNQQDYFGISLSLSADGKTVAAGAPFHGGKGQVRILHWNGSTWVQKGLEIDGGANSVVSGNPVDLSDDGNVVAIADPYNLSNGLNAGQVRVFQWNGSSWVQMGLDMDGEHPYDQFGAGLALSGDGSTVAISKPWSTEKAIQIYKWDGATWSKKGTDIVSNDSTSLWGWTLSLSSDGNILATSSFGPIPISGTVQVYRWDGSIWTKQGQNIEPDSAIISGYSVDLNANGNVLAMTSNGLNTLFTRVYNWDGNSWNQRGTDILPRDSTLILGGTVSLNAQGNVVAIGWSSGLLNDSTDIGNTQVYGWDGSQWLQYGADIAGEDSADHSGYALSISGNGNTVAIGAYGDDDGGLDAGHVRVYTLDPPIGIQTTTGFKNSPNLYPNPTSHHITIKLGSSFENITLIVRNIFGQVVSIEQFERSNKITTTIDHAPGVYFAEIITESGARTTERVIKHNR